MGWGLGFHPPHTPRCANIAVRAAMMRWLCLGGAVPSSHAVARQNDCLRHALRRSFSPVDRRAGHGDEYQGTMFAS